MPDRLVRSSSCLRARLSTKNALPVSGVRAPREVPDEACKLTAPLELILAMTYLCEGSPPDPLLFLMDSVAPEQAILSSCPSHPTSSTSPIIILKLLFNVM